MELEAKVFQSIKYHRRRARLQQARLLSPFALALVLSVTMAVIPFAAGLVPLDAREAFSGWNTQAGQYARVLGCLALLAVIAAGVSYLGKVRRLRALFLSSVLEGPGHHGGSALLKFQEALDGAAIAAGAPAPLLMVIDDTTPNALAFIDKERGPCVGVTTGMLAADFSVEEAVAIMADELARLLIGDRVRPPGVTQLEFLPNLMLLAFLVIVLVPLVLLKTRSPYPEISVLVAAAFLMFLLALKWSEYFNIRLMDLSAYHDDLLADSIAAQVSRDPDALEKAIEKVARLAKNTEGLVYVSKYLFVSPWLITGDYFRYASRMVSSRPGSEGFTRIKWAIGEEVLELESRSTKDRMINLELIRRGSKRSLDDWKVGD